VPSGWEDIGFAGYLCSQELIRSCEPFQSNLVHCYAFHSLCQDVICHFYVRDNCLLPLALVDFVIQVAGCGSLNVGWFAVA
jgi:hypothetical protein